MRTRVKEVLTIVVDELNKGGYEASDLWSILTALRGPDISNYDLKQRTTSRLRHAIGLAPDKGNISPGPRYTQQGATLSEVPLPTAEEAFDDADRDLENHHFKHHFVAAVRAMEATDDTGIL